MCVCVRERERERVYIIGTIKLPRTSCCLVEVLAEVKQTTKRRSAFYNNHSIDDVSDTLYPFILKQTLCGRCTKAE